MIYGATIATALGNTLTTNTGGYYTLQVVDSNGCSTTTSQPTIITINQRPTPVISMGGSALDAGTGYGTYKWYRGGSPISGADAQTYVPAQGGLYTVEVTDAVNGCSGVSKAYQFTALGVDNPVAAAITLHPNPASDIVRIDAPVAVDVAVLSVDGKTIYSGRNVKTLSVKDWADGVYHVVIRDQSGAFLKTEKLTKVIW
jgi:hypothetical protein